MDEREETRMVLLDEPKITKKEQIEYIKGLRNYFANEVNDTHIDPEISLWYGTREEKPCGCFGVHSAFYNDEYIRKDANNRLTFDKVNANPVLNSEGLRGYAVNYGQAANMIKGLYAESIVAALISLGDPFITFPYGMSPWPAPVAEVLDEVLAGLEESGGM